MLPDGVVLTGEGAAPAVGEPIGIDGHGAYVSDISQKRHGVVLNASDGHLSMATPANVGDSGGPVTTIDGDAVGLTVRLQGYSQGDFGFVAVRLDRALDRLREVLDRQFFLAPQ